MADQCDPQIPSSFPRRVLVATLGLAPQVLTETLYCLSQTHEETFVPTEIHVVTTLEGAHRARLTLLDPTVAMLAALEKDHDIPGLGSALPEENLHIISSRDGEFLDDIDCASDNISTADLITGLVRDLASDERCALHVSIAGGRKTMGFLLGYALSLFGRPQDRLSHVLVSSPFQDHPKFFFPPRSPVVLRDRDNRPVSTAQANVILADIPVVRLRAHLPDSLLSGKVSYSETVRQAQLLFAPPMMEINHENCTISFHDIAIKLPPATFALAAWIARHQQTGDPKENTGVHWMDGDWELYAQEYAAIGEVNAELVVRMTKRFSQPNVRNRFDDDRRAHFHEHLSHLRKHMKGRLGELFSKYNPVTFRGGKKRGTRFPLPRGAIHFVDERSGQGS